MIDTQTADIAPSTGDASVKTDAGSSNGTETDASDSSQGDQGQAGGPQGSAEGGSARDSGFRQRGPSKLDTIRDLRSKLRDTNQRYGSEIENLKAQIEEMRSMVQSGNPGKKQSRTFWEAPEEVLDERIQGHLSEMEKRILSGIQQRSESDQQSASWKQETSEAAGFIRNQKGLTEDDIAEISEIVAENPTMERLRPMERAEYAMYLWNRQKGITDKSALKAKTGTVVGAPASNSGPKQWTEAEIKRAMDKFPNNPKDWSEDHNKQWKELDREIRLAYRENRVKK